jgi:hypothetical protein
VTEAVTSIARPNFFKADTSLMPQTSEFPAEREVDEGVIYTRDRARILNVF